MKKYDISKLEPISKLMDENLYWDLIESSLEKASTEEEQEEILLTKLVTLTPEEMIGFRLRTDKFLYDTYTSKMWCAGYLMNGGCSDDGFEYFRNWVISRGREVFYKAKENPDSLYQILEEDRDEYEFETFWYVALEAFEKTTGQNLYDYIDYDNFQTKEGNYPFIEINWSEDDEESIRKLCPQLLQTLG